MDLIKLLNETKAVDDWRVSSTRRRSYELFFVHRALETVRATDTVGCSVTVYGNHDGKLGSSTFAVSDSMTEEEVRQKINTAGERAKLIFNESWQLPEGGAESVELPSNFAGYEAKTLGKAIAEAVFAADDLEGGSLNAVEVFLYEDAVRVQNSRGVDKTQLKRHAMVEAIPTWNENGESVELYENHTFTDFDAGSVTKEIAEKMREVRDRSHAVKPQTPLQCDVVLKPQEISRLIQTLTEDLNYAGVYSHSSLHKKGDDLQPGGSGDKLKVTLRAVLPGSTRSARFDEDGVELLDRTVIDDGKVVENWGSTRFAQYLGETPTGSLGCLELACGSLEKPQGRYLECVSLSGLQLDLYNDYIGGEIRLAYLHEGGEAKPVTGISMSARLSEVLGSLRLSKEAASIDGYRGPATALLKNVSIL